MADNTPDKKDIQDAQGALDKYNEALRESINYAKELSKQVGKLPENLRFSEVANNNLIKWANNYEQSLKKTLALSERIKNGRVKEREVTDQINDLTKKYQEYLYQNEASFKSTGRFLLKQKSFHHEGQRERNHRRVRCE
jgi:predicted Zn-dependent protease